MTIFANVEQTSFRQMVSAEANALMSIPNVC